MDADAPTRGTVPSAIVPTRRARRLRRRRRHRILAGAGCVLALALAVTAATILTSRGEDAGAESPALVGTVAPTSATSVSTSTSTSTTRPATSAATSPTALALSQPENPPDDEHADVPVVETGSIEIPRIGLDAPVYEGIWLTVLDVGPGHWPGTAAPGGYGNVVVAGHRATHSEPFRHLDALGPGDTIVLSDATGRYTYAVTASEVVTPEAVDIVTQRPGHTVTLFACHPPGSAAYRYVVHGELVSAPRPGA